MTNSTIAVLLEDNTIESISCYANGKHHNNGLDLFLHFKDISKIKKLISFGNLHYLRENISAPEGILHNFDNRYDNVCVFYSRDRGDNNCQYKKFNSLEEFVESKKVKFLISTIEDFTYIFDEKEEQWYVLNSYSKDLDKLNDILLDNCYIQQYIKDEIISLNLFKKMDLELPFKSIKNKIKL